MRSCFLLLSFAVLADAQGQCSQVYNASAAAAWVARAPQHVSRTGRALRRNEPIDGVCLHGAGQDPNSYASYTKFLTTGAGQITPPLVFMTYSQLANFNNSNGNTEFNGLVNTLKCYGDDTSGVYLIPQIGLAMTFDNGDGKTPPYDDKVAAGLYDYGISQFALALKALNGRPAFVRIGYEANGPWNNYTNTTFIASWIKIVNAVRADPSLNNVAFVWDVTCDFGGTSWMNFLPPETHVDWFGVNIFSNASAPVNSTECLRPFFEYSRSRGFPVMFAESTPRFVGAKVADNAWDRWFGPLISLISEFDDVTKAICYINWNWAGFPQWGNWGDARIEVAGAVGPQYRAALGSSDAWAHAMPRSAVLRVLEVA